MSPVYNRMIAGMTRPPCEGAPTISSVTNNGQLYSCTGSPPNHGWKVWGTLSFVSGSLLPGQEILWEHSIDRGAWATLGRTTSITSPNHNFTDIGTDGPGASHSHEWECRAYVVPTGAAAGSACSGPVAGTRIGSPAATLCGGS